MYEKILIGNTIPVLDKGFIQLIDYMGTDETIVNAARTSFGNEELHQLSELEAASEVIGQKVVEVTTSHGSHSFRVYTFVLEDGMWIQPGYGSSIAINFSSRKTELLAELKTNDEVLIRLLMRHNHGTPFEMCEVTFRVQVPMDCWRQWIRHRTANVNEYSTRYTEAIDEMQSTDPDQWRLQAKDNKQGSSGYLLKWPEGTKFIERVDGDDNEYIEATLQNGEIVTGMNPSRSPGDFLSHAEQEFHKQARILYEERLALGIAKEQARKDLPLSTYTRAYWKCDLRNIFHFLKLRMDSHAQLEIRQYANAMASIVKQLYPVAYKAFEDYQLNAVTFSAMEMECIRGLRNNNQEMFEGTQQGLENWPKPDSMTKREWNEFKAKLGVR